MGNHEFFYRAEAHTPQGSYVSIGVLRQKQDCYDALQLIEVAKSRAVNEVTDQSNITHVDVTCLSRLA